MEVEGRSANLITLKDIKDKIELCEPCKEDNLSRVAGGICKQCKEYMCCICFKNHLAARSCRKHELMDSKGLQINLRNVGDIDNCEVCSKHKSETIKYYCRRHDDVACGECMLLGEHKGCSTELIRCLADDFQNSDVFKGLTERIDNLKTRTGSTTDLIKLATEKNSKMNEDALTDIKMFMNDIRDIINETEQGLLSKVNEIYLQNEETLSSMANIYESNETKLESVKRDINPSICSENALFIKSVKCKRKLVCIENICSETLKNTTVKRFELRKDGILLNKLTSSGSFGTISSVVQQINENQDNGSEELLEDDDQSVPFGTAVLPHPAWDQYPARRNLAGTVIGPRKEGLLKILWSDGKIEDCKYGVKGQADIVVTPDQSVDYSPLHVGSFVVRGKHWRWKDQDGGEGNVGIVTNIDGPAVQVIWPHGVQANYRYSWKGKFDLSLSKCRRKEEFS